jgi:hypothetical protein
VRICCFWNLQKVVPLTWACALMINMIIAIVEPVSTENQLLVNLTWTPTSVVRGGWDPDMCKVKSLLLSLFPIKKRCCFYRLVWIIWWCIHWFAFTTTLSVP